MGRFSVTLLWVAAVAVLPVLPNPAAASSRVYKRGDDHTLWEISHFQEVVALEPLPSCWTSSKYSSEANCKAMRDAQAATSQFTSSTISGGRDMDSKVRNICIDYTRSNWMTMVERCAGALCGLDDARLAADKWKHAKERAEGKCGNLLPSYSSLVVKGYTTTEGSTVRTVAPVRFSADAFNFGKVPAAPTGGGGSPPANTPAKTTPAPSPTPTPPRTSQAPAPKTTSNTQPKPSDNDDEEDRDRDEGEEDEDRNNDRDEDEDKDNSKGSSTKTSTSKKPTATDKESQVRGSTSLSFRTASPTDIILKDTDGDGDIDEEVDNDGDGSNSGKNKNASDNSSSGSGGNDDKGSGNQNMPKFIGLAVGIVISLIILVAVIVYTWQRRRYAHIIASRRTSENSSHNGSESESTRRAIFLEKARPGTREFHEIFSPLPNERGSTNEPLTAGAGTGTGTRAVVDTSTGTLMNIDGLPAYELPGRGSAYEMLVEPQEMAPVINGSGSTADWARLKEEQLARESMPQSPMSVRSPQSEYSSVRSSYRNSTLQ